jgi:uncharacterized phiE125 gp8 family phage protein
MHRPTLTIAATALPVSLEQARRQCRIDADSLDVAALAEVDSLLEGYIAAAVAQLEGWTGELGRVLCESTWRQDFDRFDRCLKIPLGPVIAIETVTVRNGAGQLATVAQADYSLRTDAAGDCYCRFRNSYVAPDDLYEVAAISVTYKAGYAVVPKQIQQAILLMVGAWYENREETVIGTIAASLPGVVAAERLIASFRRVGL